MFLPWLRQLPSCWDRTLASVPSPTKGRSSLTNTPVYPPSSLSYRVLHGSIYSVLLVRYSCRLSSGVLHVLLCLKMYSWCIPEERCTPCPPTPPPSCSLHVFFFFKLCIWLQWVLVPARGIFIVSCGSFLLSFRLPSCGPQLSSCDTCGLFVLQHVGS